MTGCRSVTVPFTISHTVVVLPLARLVRGRRVLSALVIGSMLPDFGFFFPVHVPRVETHSVAGVLGLGLPIGLAAYWIFQRLIKTAIREVLPDGAYLRSLPFAPVADLQDPVQWLLASAGVLAGAATHLIWDAFTHEGARGVRMLPALDEWWMDVAGHELIGPRFLQDLSSLVGLLVVCWITLRALRPMSGIDAGARRLAPRERGVWRFAYALTAITVSASDFLIAHATDPYVIGNSHTVAQAAIASLRGLAASLLAVSLCVDFRLRGGRPHRSE